MKRQWARRVLVLVNSLELNVVWILSNSRGGSTSPAINDPFRSSQIIYVTNHRPGFVRIGLVVAVSSYVEPESVTCGTQKELERLKL